MGDVEITDEMMAGAIGLSPGQLVGKHIVAVHEIADSDRRESLLVCDDGTFVVLSCDPVTHGDAGVRLPPEEQGQRWEVVLYDATGTEAGHRAGSEAPLGPVSQAPEALRDLLAAARSYTGTYGLPDVLMCAYGRAAGIVEAMESQHT